MSSWFSYIRNSIIREEESSQQEISTAEIASTSASTSNSVPEDEQFISMVTTAPSLSHEQKEHIRDVLRRAERSGRGARVIVDSHQLRIVRPSQAIQNDSAITPSNVEMSAQSEDEDEVEQMKTAEIIQMDSLPEDVEITVGPYSSYCSYASSELMSEDSEIADRGYISRDTTELMIEESEISSQEKYERLNISQKMHKLGKKIDKWLKSLDKDELDIDMLSDGKEEGIMCEQKEEKTVEERRDDHQGANDVIATDITLNQSPVPILSTSNSFVLHYLDTLSQCICALAMEQTALKNTLYLEQYAAQFAKEVIDDILESANYLFENVIDELINQWILEAIEEVRSYFHQSTEDEGSLFENCYTIMVEEQNKSKFEEATFVMAEDITQFIQLIEIQQEKNAFKTDINVVEKKMQKEYNSSATSGADSINQLTSFEEDSFIAKEHKRAIQNDLIKNQQEITMPASEISSQTSCDDSVNNDAENEKDHNTVSTPTSGADSVNEEVENDKDNIASTPTSGADSVNEEVEDDKDNIVSTPTSGEDSVKDDVENDKDNSTVSTPTSGADSVKDDVENEKDNNTVSTPTSGADSSPPFSPDIQTGATVFIEIQKEEQDLKTDIGEEKEEVKDFYEPSMNKLNDNIEIRHESESPASSVLSSETSGADSVNYVDDEVEKQDGQAVNELLMGLDKSYENENIQQALTVNKPTKLDLEQNETTWVKPIIKEKEIYTSTFGDTIYGEVEEKKEKNENEVDEFSKEPIPANFMIVEQQQSEKDGTPQICSSPSPTSPDFWLQQTGEETGEQDEEKLQEEKDEEKGDSTMLIRESLSFNSPLPPGLEQLSEEEQMKIMSIIQCAQLDAEFTGNDEQKRPIPPPRPTLAPIKIVAESPNLKAFEVTSFKEDSFIGKEHDRTIEINDIEILKETTSPALSDISTPTSGADSVNEEVENDKDPSTSGTYFSSSFLLDKPSMPTEIIAIQQEEKQLENIDEETVNFYQSSIPCNETETNNVIGIQRGKESPSLSTVTSGANSMNDEEFEKERDTEQHYFIDLSRISMPSPPSMAKSSSDIPLPPGFEQLSEEEQMKIMALIQCAQLDAELNVKDEQKRPIPPPRPAVAPLATESQNRQSLQKLSSDLPMTNQPDLSGLSEEEQRKILMVMRAAEQQEQIEWEPTQWNMKSVNEPMETTVEKFDQISREVSSTSTSEADDAAARKSFEKDSSFMTKEPEKAVEVDDIGIQQGLKTPTLSDVGADYVNNEELEEERETAENYSIDLRTSMPTPPSMTKSLSFFNFPLPPGFEQLSEEEQMKIMSIIQCAQLDAEFTGNDEQKRPIPPPRPTLAPIKIVAESPNLKAFEVTSFKEDSFIGKEHERTIGIGIQQETTSPALSDVSNLTSGADSINDEVENDKDNSTVSTPTSGADSVKDDVENNKDNIASTPTSTGADSVNDEVENEKDNNTVSTPTSGADSSPPFSPDIQTGATVFIEIQKEEQDLKTDIGEEKEEVKDFYEPSMNEPNDNIEIRHESESPASSVLSSETSGADSVNDVDEEVEEEREVAEDEANFVIEPEEELMSEMAEKNSIGKNIEEITVKEKDAEEEKEEKIQINVPQFGRVSFPSMTGYIHDGGKKRTRQYSLTSSTTVISYTNNIQGRRWLSVSDNSASLDQQGQTSGEGEITTEKPRKISSSSVKIIITNQKLRDSFCEPEEADEQQASMPINKPAPHEQQKVEAEDLASNIDFMIKLGFYAQRITEVIAEEAAKDIQAIEQIRQNPRALYFDDEYARILDEGEQPIEEDGDEGNELSMESDIEDECQNEGRQIEGDRPIKLEEEEIRPFQVEPIKKEEEDWKSPFGGIFSSILGRRRSSAERPRSALPYLLRASPMARKGSSGDASNGTTSNSLMNMLMRKSSAVSEHGLELTMPEEGMAVELPDDALFGLSEAEKAHILRVITESRQRLPSSTEASRSSSVMLCSHPSATTVAAPDMDGLDEGERRHIESVLQKAAVRKDSPFVIQQQFRQNSLMRQYTMEIDDDEEEEEKINEKTDYKKVINEEEKVEKEMVTAEVGSADQPLIMSPTFSLDSIFPIHSLANRTDKLTPLMNEPASIGQANQKEINQNEDGVNEVIKETNVIEKERSDDEGIQKHEEELTTEEMEHIKRITEMAMQMQMEIAQHEEDTESQRRISMMGAHLDGQKQKAAEPASARLSSFLAKASNSAKQITSTGLSKEMTTGLGSKMSDRIQLLSDRTKKFTGKTTDLFGDISSKMIIGGKGEEKQKKTLDEGEICTKEPIPANFMIVEQQQSEKDGTPQICSSPSPTSPDFWLQQTGEETGEQDEEKLQEEEEEEDEEKEDSTMLGEQNIASSSTSSSTTTSTSSGLGESMYEQSIRSDQHTEFNNESQFFPIEGGTGGSSAHSLSTLAEQAETLESPVGETGDDDGGDEMENSRRVVDEISWFKQELEKMNQALMMEEQREPEYARRNVSQSDDAAIRAQQFGVGLMGEGAFLQHKGEGEEEADAEDNRTISRPICLQFLGQTDEVNEDEETGTGGNEANGLAEQRKTDEPEKKAAREDRGRTTTFGHAKTIESAEKGKEEKEATETAANDGIGQVGDTIDSDAKEAEEESEGRQWIDTETGKSISKLRKAQMEETREGEYNEGAEEEEEEEKALWREWPRRDENVESSVQTANPSTIASSAECPASPLTVQSANANIAAAGTTSSCLPAAVNANAFAPHLPSAHKIAAVHLQPKELRNLPSEQLGSGHLSHQKQEQQPSATSSPLPLIGIGHHRLVGRQPNLTAFGSISQHHPQIQQRRASESNDPNFVVENDGLKSGMSDYPRDRSHSTDASAPAAIIPRVPTPVSGPTLADNSNDFSAAGSFSSFTTTPASSSSIQSVQKSSANPHGSMFGLSGQKSTNATGFTGFGNKFSKLATSTLKGAMQAGEQLGHKAAIAVEKANQAMAESAAIVPQAPSILPIQPTPPPSSTSTLSLTTTSQMPQQSQSSMGLSRISMPSPPSMAKSSSDIPLPPGFEQLSEEEQMKIMALIQCAQLDAELNVKDEQKRPIPPPRPAVAPLATESQNRQSLQKLSSDLPMTNQPDLSGLSEEEQRKILMVMRAAEQQEQIEWEPTQWNMKSVNEPMETTISHEKLNAPERAGPISAEGKIETANVMEKVEKAKETKGEEEEEEEEEEGLGNGAIIEGSLSFLENLSKYGGQSIIGPAGDGEMMAQKEEQKEGEEEEMEEDEELWMQPPRPEFTAPPDHWDNVSVSSSQSARKLWTTVFTEEGAENAGGAAQQQQRVDKDSKIHQEDEELAEISAETVRGCWEMGEAVKRGERSGGTEGISQQQKEMKMAEEVANVARSIYTKGFGTDGEEEEEEEREGDKQQEEEKGGDVRTTTRRMVVGRMQLMEEEQGNNSYEIEMEDPWSPSFTAKSMSDAAGQHEKGDFRQMIPPPTITVTTEELTRASEEESEDEEEEEEEDGIKGKTGQQERQTSSSSEEEDDYPDMVIKAPTVSPAAIVALQEESEMEQQKITAEVFQQIQAFGEAADDEFDVQWAKTAQQQKEEKLPKIVAIRDNFFMEDAANVYSPPEQQQQPKTPTGTKAADEKGHQTGVVEEKQQQQQQVLYRQRTNPFLAEEREGHEGEEAEEDGEDEEEEEEEEDDEETQDVIVQQEHLDAEDHEAESAEAERYYKGQFDHSLYFAHRPGPVYTIPENPIEEETGTTPNREGIYHANRIERKPLHSETVPQLITPEEAAASARRRSKAKSTASGMDQHQQPQQQPAAQRYWASSAGDGIMPSLAHPSTGAHVDSQKSVEQLATDAQITPIRSAPPPPPAAGGGNERTTTGGTAAAAEQHQQHSATGSPPTTGAAPIAGSTNNNKMHSMSAALHLQQQLQQMNQHKFVNKAKDIAQQEDLPPPSKHGPTNAVAGGGLTTETEDAEMPSQSPRLKRSPAMNLMGLGQSKRTPIGTAAGEQEQQQQQQMDEKVLLENAHQTSQSATTGTAQPSSTASCSSVPSQLPFSTEQQQQEQPPPPTHPFASTSLPSTATTSSFVLLPSSSIPIVSSASSSIATATTIPTSSTAAVTEMGRRRLPTLPSSVQPFSSSASLLYSSSSSSSAAASIFETTASTSYASYPFVEPSSSIDAQIGQQQQPSSILSSFHGAAAHAHWPSAHLTHQSQQSQQISPIIYYTSCAPEKKDVAVNGSVPTTAGHPMDLPPLAESRVLFDPSVVASAQSVALCNRSPQWRASSSVATAITTTTMSTPLRPYGSAEWHKSAIIPGATFRPTTAAGRTSPSTRPLSAIHFPSSITSFVPTVSASLSPPRRQKQQQQPCRSRTMPASERATQETLCQLRFKKQLRDTLAKRKEALDMCEIEASHRQYVIDKWRRTGLLPLHLLRPAELDSIPAVVKCSLPPELVAGVRIKAPISRHQMMAGTKPEPLPYGPLPPSTFTPRRQPQQQQPAAAAAATAAQPSSSTLLLASYYSTSQQQQQPKLLRTLGCQTDGPTASTAFYNTERCWRTGTTPSAYMLPSTSLSQQLRAHHHPIAAAPIRRDASTQTALCAETQTSARGMEGIEDIPQQQPWNPWPDAAAITGRHVYQPQHDYFQPSWEETTRRYPWEEPASAEQRHFGRKRRGRINRFLAPSDTTSERGRKEQMVQEELERRRRELRYSLDDLRAEWDLGRLPPSAHAYPQPQQQQQYGTTRTPAHFYQQQHWSGSLPRGFEFTNQFPSAAPMSLPMGTAAVQSSPSSVFQSPQPRRPTAAAAAYGYGSLPRNYERRMGTSTTAGYSPVDFQQAHLSRFGPPPVSAPISPAVGGFTSRSMQDLDRLGGTRMDQFGRRWAGTQMLGPGGGYYPSRSMNYLDQQIGPPERELMAYGQPTRWPQQQQQPTGMGAIDDFGIGQQQQQQDAADSQDLLLSEYANYLNSQFLMDQQQRELADRETMLLAAERMPPPQPFHSPHLHHPFGHYPSSFAPAGPVEQPPSLPNYPGMLGQSPYGYGYDQQQLGPNYGPMTRAAAAAEEQPPGVYSRNEANYGARPPAQWTADYGNLYWPRQPQQPQRIPRGATVYDGTYNPLLEGRNWPSQSVAAYVPQQQQAQPSAIQRPLPWMIRNTNTSIGNYQPMTAANAASHRLAQQQRMGVAAPQSILRRRAPPLKATTATGDEIWPREGDWPMAQGRREASGGGGGGNQQYFRGC